MDVRTPDCKAVLQFAELIETVITLRMSAQEKYVVACDFAIAMTLDSMKLYTHPLQETDSYHDFCQSFYATTDDYQLSVTMWHPSQFAAKLDDYLKYWYNNNQLDEPLKSYYEKIFNADHDRVADLATMPTQ